MFWRILGKAFTKGLKSKFLAVITIAFGASLAAAMLTISLDVGDKINKELKTYGANLMVEPITETIPLEIAGVNFTPLASTDYIKEADLPKIKMIFWAYNIVGFTPYLDVRGEVGDRQNSKGTKVTMTGTWFDKHLQIETGEELNTGVKLLKPWWEIEGEWVDDQETSDLVMVGNRLAEKYGLVPGSRFEFQVESSSGVRTAALYVAGIIKGDTGDEDKIYAPLSLVQELMNQEGRVSRVEVSALTTPENELSRKAEKDQDALSGEEFERWYCTAYVSSIAYQIEEAILGVSAKPILKVASSEGVILGKIQLLMFLLTAVALISSALGISSLMTTNVLERSKEIGLMKAVGAEDWQVSLLFLTETAITGLIGGVAGYSLGLGFAQIIGHNVFGTGLTFKAPVIPIVLLLSVGIATAGSFSAIRTVIKLRPAEVLHGGR